MFHPKAVDEYLAACNWYENEHPGLGTRFKVAVLGQVQRIVNNPEFYPVKNRNFRESNVKVFPYVIVYKIDYGQQIIYISAIYHTKRKPKRKYRQ